VGGSGGSWRRLHNDELHNLHASLNIIRMIKSKMDRAYGIQGRDDKCIQNFGWKI
jgi:hypothetical protein